jgi:hypothetical protein
MTRVIGLSPSLVADGHQPVIGLEGSEPEDAEAFLALGNAFKTKIEELLGKKLADAPKNLPPAYNLRDHRTHAVGGAYVTLLSSTVAAAKENAPSMKRIPPAASAQ